MSSVMELLKTTVMQCLCSLVVTSFIINSPQFIHDGILLFCVYMVTSFIINSPQFIHDGILLFCVYMDEFVSLPPVIPRGPVALLGLGAGTAAHLMLEVWPWIQLVGWEIDPMIIELSRDYFGMSNLEKTTELGGSLSVRIGDALSPSVTVEGGFAGIIVDLFADGKVLPQLQEAETWLEIAKKLMPDGRIMVNCGGADTAVSLAADTGVSSWVQNPTIKALCSAFPGQLNWKRLSEKQSVNYVALTGPLPDLEEWSTSVPSELSPRVKQWVPCELA